MKNDPRTIDRRAHGRRAPPSQESDRDVSDPHPGSVSDGTHPEANENKLPWNEGDRKLKHQTESPAVKSLQEEQARQASADAKGKLQKGLEDTFPASDPVSATNTSTVKKHVEPTTSAEGTQSERNK